MSRDVLFWHLPTAEHARHLKQSSAAPLGTPSCCDSRALSWRLEDIKPLENGVRRRMAVLIVAENDEGVRAINWYRQKEIVFVVNAHLQIWVWISPTFCLLYPHPSFKSYRYLDPASEWPFVLLWWLSTLTLYTMSIFLFWSAIPLRVPLIPIWPVSLFLDW